MNMLGAVVLHFASIIAALDWWQLALLVGFGFIAVVLWRCQVAPDDFDLRHLIVSPDTGRLDRFAFAYLVGLVALTWITLGAAMNGRFVEWLAAVYVVYCGAPKSIEVWLNARRPA
jgi:hypothetical protein